MTRLGLQQDAKRAELVSNSPVWKPRQSGCAQGESRGLGHGGWNRNASELVSRVDRNRRSKSRRGNPLGVLVGVSTDGATHSTPSLCWRRILISWDCAGRSLEFFLERVKPR